MPLVMTLFRPIDGHQKHEKFSPGPDIQARHTLVNFIAQQLLFECIPFAFQTTFSRL